MKIFVIVASLCVLLLFAGSARNVDATPVNGVGGAALGAAAGAAVAGPVGAVIGGLGGAIAGHEHKKHEKEKAVVAAVNQQG